MNPFKPHRRNTPGTRLPPPPAPAPAHGVWVCSRGCPAAETCKAIHGGGTCEGAPGVAAGAPAMHPDCTAPDCDCEPGIECAARGAARGVSASTHEVQRPT